MASDRQPGTRQGRDYDGGYHPQGVSGRSDEEIAEGVCDRLIHDERLDARRIDVAVAQGVVTLSGEVDTLVAKRAAGDDAWDTGGVADVSNILRISAPEQRD